MDMATKLSNYNKKKKKKKSTTKLCRGPGHTYNLCPVLGNFMNITLFYSLWDNCFNFKG